MLQASEQTAVQVRLTAFNLLSISTKKWGIRRVRIVAFEIEPECVIVISRKQWWNPYSDTVAERGSYTDEDLKKVPGVRDVHLQLVQAVRAGQVEEFFRQHCKLDLSDSTGQWLLERWCRELPIVN